MNSPILYNDPSGHDSIISEFFAGVASEVVSSVGWFIPPLQANLAPSENESVAKLAGRIVGDIASIAIGVLEVGAGGGAITGGTLCAGLTAGGCLPVGAPTVVAGGVLALEGAGTGVRGAIGLGVNLYLMMAKTQDHHIATNKNFKSGQQWSKKFKEDFFDPAGLDLNDTDNIVSLENHQGPHPDSYHQWVYDRLSQATKGLTNPSKLNIALRAELRSIGRQLLNDASILFRE